MKRIRPPTAMIDPITKTLPRIPRVEALIGSMSLREKAGQLTQRGISPNDDMSRLLEGAKLGEIGLSPNARSLEQRNILQRAAVEQSRLGIPIIFRARRHSRLSNDFSNPARDGRNIRPTT